MVGTPDGGPRRTSVMHRLPHPVAAALVAALVAVGCAPMTTDVASTTDGPPTPVSAPSSAAPQPSPGATVETVSYADHPDTVFDVHRPTAAPSGTTVVLVHGGFWREQYVRDLMDPLVPSLLEDGHVVVNLEYRRVRGDGGWPTTLTDVAAGFDAVAGLDGVDPGRVVAVGHSAGGHLVTWLAARHRLPDDAPGAQPGLTPCHVVAQAPVVVLDEALGLSDGAVAELLGGDDADRRRIADPSAWLPLDVPVTLVHAPADDLVPVSQSERWVALATAAGDTATLVTAPGDHFSVIDPTHELWDAARTAVRDAC